MGKLVWKTEKIEHFTNILSGNTTNWTSAANSAISFDINIDKVIGDDLNDINGDDKRA